MAFTNLTLTALGRCHINHLTLSCPSLFNEFYALTAWIKLCQSIVIPQYTIAFTRNQHWNTDLSIHLRQSSRQATHIAIAILELSEAEQALILWRIEGQRSLTAHQLMGLSCKNGFAAFIFHYQGITLNYGSDIGLFQHIVFYIEPVGQITFRRLISVSHPHGILGHIG